MEDLAFTDMIRRACPVCSSPAHTVLHVQKFSDAPQHTIASCNICKTTYVRDVPTEEEYAEHYRDDAIYAVTRDQDIHAYSYTFLSKYTKSKDAILDVGCATGNLLGLFKRHGYKQLLGLDPSPSCRIYARKEFGIEVKTKTLETFSSKKTFDLIILSNVLEHIPDVKKAIASLTSLLSQDGKLFIAVPDAGTFSESVMEPFYEFSTEHINFFTKDTLRYVMSGYQAISLKGKGGVLYSLWQRSHESEDEMRRYIRLSERKFRAMQKTIRSLPDTYYAWGAGSFARRLAATAGLRPVAFIDRNPYLVGKTIGKIPIIAPSQIRQHIPIIVTSYRYKAEILSQIRKEWKNSARGL